MKYNRVIPQHNHANLLPTESEAIRYGAIYFRTMRLFSGQTDLTLICGHWGETLPYYFNRLDSTLTLAVTELCHEVSYYFKNNRYLTPSGMFFDDDLFFCLDKVGADRILWATDYPCCEPENSKNYLARLPVPLEQKEKSAYGNVA